MNREEIVRDRVYNLVMRLFDSANIIAEVEGDGVGSLDEVLDEVRNQMEHINEDLNSYLHADSAYRLSLRFGDEDEDEDEDDEDDEE